MVSTSQLGWHHNGDRIMGVGALADCWSVAYSPRMGYGVERPGQTGATGTFGSISHHCYFPEHFYSCSINFMGLLLSNS